VIGPWRCSDISNSSRAFAVIRILRVRAYCVFGHVGMSEGRRPDLQYSRHAFAEFKSRLRAKARDPFFILAVAERAYSTGPAKNQSRMSE
jgi:hypothetical protein